MALVKCPECGKEISDMASSCIHCGCPLEHSTPVFAEETTNKTSLPKRNTHHIVSATLTAVSLIITVYANFMQSPEMISLGRTFSGGLFVLLSISICIIAALIYVLPFKFCLKASCISTTLYFLVALLCQIIFLLRYSFPAIFFIIALAAISAYIIIYWLSVVGIMQNSKPLIVAAIVYFLLVFIEMLYARGYGSIFSSAFFITSIPPVLYCIASFLYVRTNTETAYAERKAKIDFEQAQPKQGTSLVQDAPSTGFAVLCFCFPIVGLILYCVWRETLPQRAKSAGVGGLLGFIIGVVLVVIAYGILLS